MRKILLLLSTTLLAVYARAPIPQNADLVASLPQMPDLSFGLYSGMLTISGTKKQLHYVAALSQGDWTTDPVLLWFNGGPGCSSMLGWTQEHGPYVIEDGQTQFTQNAYSWNKLATVVYFDSPAGVGYSVCGDPKECAFDDNNTADDNLAALLALMTDKLPQLQANPLYLAGESYAGIYVPKLAQKIDDYTTGKKGPYLPNLKGIIVGNPVTDHKVDGKPAQFEMAYWFGLIDDALYSNVKAHCNLSYWDFDAGLLSAQCKNWLNTFNSLISNINHYDFLGKCYIEPQPTLLERKLQSNMAFFTVSDYTPFDIYESKQLQMIPPCVYALPVYYYLNTRAVMDALHVPQSVTKWEFCLDKGDLDYTRLREGSIGIYPLLKGKYRILVYSGDTDGVVPTYGTKAWVGETLAWPVTQKYKQFFVDGQVGGYTEVRDGMVYATIHGGGHMAAQWKRSYTYTVVQGFLKN